MAVTLCEGVGMIVVEPHVQSKYAHTHTVSAIWIFKQTNEHCGVFKRSSLSVYKCFFNVLYYQYDLLRLTSTILL